MFSDRHWLVVLLFKLIGWTIKGFLVVMKDGSTFKKNVIILMSGTIMAQALPVALSPILSRLYGPEDFGLLALYSALVSILGTVATLRYDLAIIQPKGDGDASALVWISVASVIVMGVIIAFYSILYNYLNLGFLGSEKIRPWLYLLPFSVIIVGLFQTSNKWLLRNSSYNVIAKATVIQSASSSGMQVTLGLSFLSGGLICGQFFGQAISFIVIAIKTFRMGKVDSIIRCKGRIVYNIKQYKNMPLFSTGGALADILSVQMPVLVISRFFLEGTVGSFSLTFRMLNIPAVIISTAISQVLYKKINDMANSNSRNITWFVIRLWFLNLLIILPFVVVIYFYAGDLFVLMFGALWSEAGQMAKILVFAAAIRFVVSPLSSVLAVDKNIRIGVLWQFLYLFTLSITLYIYSSDSIITLLHAFVVHELVQYMVYFSFILKGAQRLERII